MSLFRHIFVISVMFACQAFTTNDETITSKPDVAKFSFNRTQGSWIMKITMENEECNINEGYEKIKPGTSRSDGNPELDTAETVKNIPGNSKKNPAESCRFVEESGFKYVKSPTDPIKVYCDIEEKSTCVKLINKIDDSLIDESSVNFNDHAYDYRWLSEAPTAQGKHKTTVFDVQKHLYNGLDRLQISHLLSLSIKTIHKIRYYFKSDQLTNSLTRRESVYLLKALLWNDHLFDANNIKVPISFTASDTQRCWDERYDWICSNVFFTSAPGNRLPVTDFYVKDLRSVIIDKYEFRFYCELDELCFYNK